MIKDTKPYRILIVEDNTGDFILVQELLSEQMETPGIVHAYSFNEAITILREKTVTFDAILLDLTLADKSGADLVSGMLTVAGPAPVIVLTGYTDIDFSRKSIAKGILDYLLKDELDGLGLYKSIVYAIERKKAVTELKKSEKRYSDLFHLSPQPMWVFDAVTFRFVQVNRAAIELYGYSEEEFLNMTLFDIMRQEDVVNALEEMENDHCETEHSKRSIQHLTKSGHIIDLETYSTPITIGDKVFRSVIAIDATQTKLYEHKIIKAIIKTQEDERYEIGGELHDNVCQILATGQLKLGMLKKFLDPLGLHFLNEVKENINLALTEIRGISHRLAPAFFDESTMEEAFNRLLAAFNTSNQYSVILVFDEAVKICPLSMEIKLNMYRILQEQLRNIEKYANAAVIEVDVSLHQNKLRMRIADNGIGFINGLSKNGIGLANMKRRTELFSGKFEINSSPGNGCEIIVVIPVNENKVD